MPRKRQPKQRQLSHGRGTLEMNVVIEGVRIRRATGTTDSEQFRNYESALRMLANAGRVDILREVASGKLRFSEVWDVVRPHGDRPANLNRLPSPATMRPLFTTLQAWAERHTNHHTRRNMLRDVRALTRFGTPQYTVQALPDVLAAYRDYCEARETYRTFDAARATVQSFLRDTLRRSHPLYGAVLDLAAFGVPSRAGKPLTPAELHEWLPRVAQAMGQMYADAFRAQTVTGMRLAEYWGDWAILDDRVRLRSAKQKRGEIVYRVTPLIESFDAPQMAYGTYSTAFEKRGLNTLHTPYDARRTFARACEEVRIPQSRWRAYLGHGIRTVSDLYVRHEVTPYLKDDAAALRQYLELPEIPRTFMSDSSMTGVSAPDARRCARERLRPALAAVESQAPAYGANTVIPQGLNANPTDVDTSAFTSVTDCPWSRPAQTGERV